MKSIVTATALVVLTGCTTAPFGSRGWFSVQRPEEGAYFVTRYDRAYRSGQVRTKDPFYLHDGEFHYYEWKTIKTQRTEGGKTFPSYRTLLNSELDRMPRDEAVALLNSDRVLSNYLFFVDDYRVVFLSEDDQRAIDSPGVIRLFLDNDQYKLKWEPDQERFRQFLRGYYSLEGDALLIDFEHGGSFFIKATLGKDSVVFDHFSKDPRAVARMHPDQVAFTHFDELLLIRPVFELPDTSMTCVDVSFTLDFGFLDMTGPEQQRPLHKALIDIRHQAGSSLGVPPDHLVAAEISDITYDLSDPRNPVRTYQFRLLNVVTLALEGPFTVQEKLLPSVIQGW